jgi:Flp pilus assembly protein TadD
MQSEALEIESKLMVEYPNDEAAHGMYGVIAAWMDQLDQSLWATKRAVQLSGNNPMVMTTYTYALARSGQIEEARALADMLLSKRFPRAPRPHLAMTYVALGNTDKALELLDEARVEKCPWFRPARYDPRIGELQSDKRLIALYENVG